MSTGRPTYIRYAILVLLCLSTTIAYLTRVISAATGKMQEEYQLSDTQMGDVLAAFALGYFWFQVPGGLLATWLGVRVVFPVIVLLWSVACVWMTFASGESGLHWSRFALGVAQAGLVPCCVQALGIWFPIRQRGVASSIVAFGMQIGAVLATALTAWLVVRFSWQQVYFVYAFTGLLWAVAFLVVYRENPERHPWVNDAEREVIAEGRVELPVGATDEPRSAGRVVLLVLVALTVSLTMWMFCLQAFCRAFTYDFFTTWFPTYLQRSRGIDLLEAGLLSTAPLAGFGLGGLVGGVMVDYLYRRTGSKPISRCGVASASLLACAGCMLAASLVTRASGAVAIISLGSFVAAIAGAATWATALDIGGKFTALIAGIMNLAGNVGAYFCPIVVAQMFVLIEADPTSSPGTDYNLILYLFAGINVAGALAWLFVNPNRQVVRD